MTGPGLEWAVDPRSHDERVGHQCPLFQEREGGGWGHLDWSCSGARLSMEVVLRRTSKDEKETFNENKEFPHTGIMVIYACDWPMKMQFWIELASRILVALCVFEVRR